MGVAVTGWMGWVEKKEVAESPVKKVGKTD